MAEITSVQIARETMVARATGSAAIAATVAPGKAWRLKAVRVHLSAAGGADNLTVQVDAGAGAVYDTVLLTQDMTSIVDLAWEEDHLLAAGDRITVAWANGSARTYGLEVVYEWLVAA